MGLKREDVIKRIGRYLQRSDSHPRFVNVNNPEDMDIICRHFSVGENVFKGASDFSVADENLSEDVLYNFLGRAQGSVFITGITSYYRLLGEQNLHGFIDRMIGMSLTGLHLVIVCYQCENYLAKIEQRYSQFVYMVDGKRQELPQLTFAAQDLPATAGDIVVEGVQNIASSVEHSSSSKLFVHTGKHRSSYPFSLYTIKELSNSFEVLCSMDVSTGQLREEYGTEQDWDF
ncbi:MAG: hypothetical protein GX777_08985, partial [Fastidiosipila sp.]|nr:hypothetical protein [Fastidiosipila sp.]